MSIHMRRARGEATGPTEAEFATQGVSFLVGMITPWRRDRLFPQYKASPVDYEYADFEYLDALPALIGGLGPVCGAVFASGKKKLTPEELQAKLEEKQIRAEARVRRRETRQENRTAAAAKALLNWASNEGIVIHDLWTAGPKGNGFIFEAQDAHTLQHMTQRARGVAKDPRFQSYVTVIPSVDEGRYLVAFVREPHLVPVTFENAIAIAEAEQDPTSDMEVTATALPTAYDPSTDPVMQSLDDSMSRIRAMQEEMDEAYLPGAGAVSIPHPDLEPIEPPVSAGPYQINVTPVQGAEVGKIGDFFKKTFGPKKPEGIQKKIDKLKERIEKLKGEIEEWEAKKKEAEESGGMLVGNIYGAAPSMMARFQSSSAQRYSRFNPGMFMDAADELGMEPGEVARFRASEAQRYSLNPRGRFLDAEDVSYDAQDPSRFVDAEGGEAHYIGSLDDMRDQLKAKYRGELQRGEISKRTYQALCNDLPNMTEEEVLEELFGDDAVGLGFAAAPRGGSIAKGPRHTGRVRRQKKKARRRAKRRAMRGARGRGKGKLRKSLRKKFRMMRRGGGGGGGGGSAIYVLDGGDSGGDDFEGDDFEDDDEFDDDSDEDSDDDSDESDGVGSFGLSMGRVYDAPLSPHGYVINYPAGG